MPKIYQNRIRFNKDSAKNKTLQFFYLNGTWVKLRITAQRTSLPPISFHLFLILVHTHCTGEVLLPNLRSSPLRTRALPACAIQIHVYLALPNEGGVCTGLSPSPSLETVYIPVQLQVFLRLRWRTSWYIQWSFQFPSVVVHWQLMRPESLGQQERRLSLQQWHHTTANNRSPSLDNNDFSKQSASGI